MKILFLDIDGVLNSHTDFLEAEHYGHPFNHGYTVISSGKLFLLEHIISETGAKIIISSTWRASFSLENIYNMFKERGFTLPRTCIIGKTNQILVKFSTRLFDRSKEISDWLDSHPNVDEYAILDDIEPSYFEDRHKDNLVTTSEYDGLNFPKAEHVIDILGRTEEAKERMKERITAARFPLL